jgi:hypothetical protein
MQTTLHNETFKSWLAGFIDGEGCIGTNGKSKQIRITIANTNKEVLLLIQKLYGGCLVTQKHTKHPDWKTAYRLSWSSKKALSVLYDVLPYLILKQSQAKICLTINAIQREITQKQTMLIPKKRDELGRIMEVEKIHIPQTELIEQRQMLASELNNLNKKGI